MLMMEDRMVWIVVWLCNLWSFHFSDTKSTQKDACPVPTDTQFLVVSTFNPPSPPSCKGSATFAAASGAVFVSGGTHVGGGDGVAVIPVGLSSTWRRAVRT